MNVYFRTEQSPASQQAAPNQMKNEFKDRDLNLVSMFAFCFKILILVHHFVALNSFNYCVSAYDTPAIES